MIRTLEHLQSNLTTQDLVLTAYKQSNNDPSKRNALIACVTIMSLVTQHVMEAKSRNELLSVINATDELNGMKRRDISPMVCVGYDLINHFINIKARAFNGHITSDEANASVWDNFAWYYTTYARPLFH